MRPFSDPPPPDLTASGPSGLVEHFPRVRSTCDSGDVVPRTRGRHARTIPPARGTGYRPIGESRATPEWVPAQLAYATWPMASRETSGDSSGGIHTPEGGS